MLKAVAGAVFLMLALGACATSPVSSLSEFAAQSGHNSFEVIGRSVPANRTLVLDLVHDRQTSGPSCGAHALASVVNYWKTGNVTGERLFAEQSPAAPSGYSLAELISLAQSRGLIAAGVRLPEGGLIDELERGRPVLTPVRVPAVFIQPRTMPAANVPILGLPANLIAQRAARLAEASQSGMVDHYVVVAGYGPGRFVVLEPVLGYRTISFERFARYRRAFSDAAIVFSSTPGATHTQLRGVPSDQQVRWDPGM